MSDSKTNPTVRPSSKLISVVVFTDDGKAREVLLDQAQRLAVKMLLQQMFLGRKIPVSETELPLYWQPIDD